jgi:hypothetical protein
MTTSLQIKSDRKNLSKIQKNAMQCQGKGQKRGKGQMTGRKKRADPA